MLKIFIIQNRCSFQTALSHDDILSTLSKLSVLCYAEKLTLLYDKWD